MKFLSKLGAGAALGAVAAFFLDKDRGTYRRNKVAQKTMGTFRQTGRKSGRVMRRLSSDAQGMVERAKHVREEPKDYDDKTLKNRIETEVFRPADAPKGDVVVNVQGGIVQLRGEVEDPKQIEEIVSKVEKIQGVRSVENLLHLPGTPAPMHQ